MIVLVGSDYPHMVVVADLHCCRCARCTPTLTLKALRSSIGVTVAIGRLVSVIKELSTRACPLLASSLWSLPLPIHMTMARLAPLVPLSRGFQCDALAGLRRLRPVHYGMGNGARRRSPDA